MEILWRKEWRHRFGTLRVSLSNSPVNARPTQVVACLTRTIGDLDSNCWAKFDWHELVPETVRYIYVQQVEASIGGGDSFRGLEIHGVKIKGAGLGMRCANFKQPINYGIINFVSRTVSSGG